MRREPPCDCVGNRPQVAGPRPRRKADVAAVRRLPERHAGADFAGPRQRRGGQERVVARVQNERRDADARDLREFDEIFTGPLHGFAGADDYYARSSAKAQLARIRIPALVLNARNDPFLPASAANASA
jgi:pimeloyl-ACP methyl ester carboxylesterase